jgi:hypothetical protein
LDLNQRKQSFIKINRLRGDDARASRAVGGDGMAAQFNGGWFSAGQGINDELDLTAKALT